MCLLVMHRVIMHAWLMSSSRPLNFHSTLILNLLNKSDDVYCALHLVRFA